MPLATFAAWYKLPTKAQLEKEELAAGGDGEDGGDCEDEDLPTRNEDPCPEGLPDTIQLQGEGASFVTRRKRKCIVRYHRFDPKKDGGEELHYSTLVLFYPFQKEEEDLSLASAGFPSYKAFVKAKEAQIKPLLLEFEAYAGPIAAAYEEMGRERQEALDNRLAANAESPDCDGDGDGDRQKGPQGSTFPSHTLIARCTCCRPTGSAEQFVDDGVEDEFGFLDPGDLVVDMMAGVRGFGDGGDGGEGGEGADGDAPSPAPAFQLQQGIALSKDEILSQLSDMESKMNSDQAV